MKQISIEELAKYSNQYIALTKGRANILASGRSIQDVENKLKKLDISQKENITIEFIEPTDMYISPLCR